MFCEINTSGRSFWSGKPGLAGLIPMNRDGRSARHPQPQNHEHGQNGACAYKHSLQKFREQRREIHEEIVHSSGS